MNQRKNLIIIMPFLLILVLFFIKSFRIEDVGYSMEESRALKTIDNINWENWKELSHDIEKYVVDQFPFRTDFLRVYSKKDKYLRKKFSRDVYISEEDWIFAESSANKMEFVSSNLKSLLDKYPSKSFYYSILPTKNVALRDEYYFTKNTVALKNYKRLKDNLSKLNIDNLYIIDLIPNASSHEFLNDKSKWYRTDFHWNAAGAKVATDFILEELKSREEIEYLYEDGDIWIEYLYKKLYRGDLNKRFSYIYGIDEIPVIIRTANEELYKYYQSEDNSVPLERKAIISSKINEETVDYAGAYTPNLAYYRVINELAPNDKSILIIKDSMQNASIDVFSETFYETKVIDPRLKQRYLINEVINNVDIILFMYHQSNDSEEAGNYIK